MKLSVAANYDLDLVPKLAQHGLCEVYGKLPADVIGGGRPSYMASPLTKRGLARYVECLSAHGIAFNYLLNAACLGNREWSRRWQKSLAQLLERLEAMGVARLTVSTPYLLERVKATFPQFHVKVGVFAQVDTVRRARFWEDLGADAITLESFSINRDFSTLRAIRQAVACELQLIANHPCLPNCAMQPYHQNGLAHSSNGSRDLFIDYCFLSCTLKRLEDPALLIEAGWIRPEDTSYYEAMGYEHFKLLERGIPSSELFRRVAAYANRTSGENLATLILPYGFTQAPKKQRLWLLRHFFRPGQVNPFKLAPLYRMLKQQGMLFPTADPGFHIDSARIPNDFVQGFEQRHCPSLDCRRCGYCPGIAADAVTIDPMFRSEQLERLKTIKLSLANGSLWGV